MAKKFKYTGELSVPVPSKTSCARFRRALKYKYVYMPYLPSIEFMNARTKEPVNHNSLLFETLKKKLLEKHG